MLRTRALLSALAGIAGRLHPVTVFRAVPLKPFVAYVQREGRLHPLMWRRIPSFSPIACESAMLHQAPFVIHPPYTPTG